MAGKSLSQNQFLEKCQQIHNNKYDYSETFFKSTRENIIVICPLHGIFEQRASAHLSGQGCKNCKTIATKKRFLHTKDQFLESINDWQKNNLDFLFERINR